MDSLFRALADPTRRLLLDALRARDGQTLLDLCKPVALTRFGVMRHLAVLEEAGLVTTRKVGRAKFHYLNPVPLVQLLDRWMSRYAQPFARAMVDLKGTLEVTETIMKPPAHVFTIYIRATPEAVWDAITNAERTPHWFRGTRVESDWSPGSPVCQVNPDGSVVLDGTLIEFRPPHRLVTTFNGPRPQFAADRESRVTWDIAADGEVTKLTLTHDDFDGETATYRAVAGGWPMHLSALKTLLETGEPLKRAA